MSGLGAPSQAGEAMGAMPAAPLGRAPSTPADRAETPAAAWAYLVRCDDGSLYAGWTNDLARRLRAHRTGKGGARYTKMRGGARLAYAERCADKSAALKREAALKKLAKPQKEALAAAWAAENRLTLRMATPDDAPAVNELYRWYVTHTTASFQYTPEPDEAMRGNIAAVLEKAPFLLAENAAGRLCGYACAHPWHSRGAYAWDVELTVYCAPDCVGQGVGRRLYLALLALLKRQGYCNAVALVVRPNPASEAFHKALGFRKIGTEPRTGYKFGQWLDLQYWWLDLRAGAEAPRPVRLQLPAGAVREVLEGLPGFLAPSDEGAGAVGD